MPVAPRIGIMGVSGQAKLIQVDIRQPYKVIYSNKQAIKRGRDQFKQHLPTSNE